MNEIRVLRHTRKSVRTGYDVRGRKEGERKTKEEKSKNVKQEKQRRTQKRAPESVPFAFICGLRGHSALYILSRRLPFVYSFSFSRMSIFLASFSSLFHSPSSAPLAIVPHVRAVYALSSRNYFAYMPLPFSLSSATLCHPSDPRALPLPSHGTITRPSVKYTFVGGPAMWRPVIYFSSNCNFSNTYCPLDKCASLFLTR